MNHHTAPRCPGTAELHVTAIVRCSTPRFPSLVFVERVAREHAHGDAIGAQDRHEAVE